MAKKEDGGISSPLIDTIDPRQVAANNLTANPDEVDHRYQPGTDMKLNPATPDDVSQVVDPADPMTLPG